MSATVVEEPEARPGLAAALLPIMGVVFVAFLVIGIAMPVLPIHVHDGLGLGTFVVGLVAGSQFAASLISRPWAGHYSDGRGAKRGVIAACSRPRLPERCICCRSGSQRRHLAPSRFSFWDADCSAGQRASSSRLR